MPTRARQSSDDQLFARWREEHDGRAREELIARHLPMARRLAARYTGRRQPVDDLVQIASLGLVKAVGVGSDEAAVFEDALAGVEAGRAGGFKCVVGVDRVGQADALREHGAHVVVEDLAELLEQR